MARDTKILAVVSDKGGVGKSTTSFTMASILGQRGYRVLIMDLDRQSNTTSSLGFDPNSKDNMTVNDVFFNDVKIADAILATEFDNLDVILSSRNQFKSPDARLIGISKPSDTVLKRALREFKQELKNDDEDYDFLILDCPPNLELVVVNALMVATDVIIPATPDEFALDGIMGIVEFINGYIEDDRMPNFNGYAILVTILDDNSRTSKNMIATLEEYDQSYDFFHLYKSRIPRNVAIRESATFHKPVNYFQPKCKGCLAYRDAVAQLIEVTEKGW